MEQLFGKRLAELRREKNLTQEALAREIGVTHGQISFWENGKNEPTAGNLIKLAKFFCVSADYLLGLSEY